MDSRIASSIAGGTVILATCIYGMAAAQAFGGTIPGPYVSLLAYAPIGLMATSLPLMYSVFRVVVPDKEAAIMLGLAAVSGTAFQAAVLNGKAPSWIGALAVFNLVIFYYAAKTQGALTSNDRKARFEHRKHIANALHAARLNRS
jgi:hypothetical protein